MKTLADIMRAHAITAENEGRDPTLATYFRGAAAELERGGLEAARAYLDQERVNNAATPFKWAAAGVVQSWLRYYDEH